MKTSETLFVDTSFLIAITNTNDQFHARAVSFLQSSPPFLAISSNLILSEFITFSSRYSSNLEDALLFQSRLMADKSYKIYWVDKSIHDDALKIILKFSDHKLSFVDATSFALMKKHKVSKALTFDKDFTSAGFLAVPVK